MFAEWVVQEQLSWVVKAQGHSWGCSQAYSHPKAWQGPEDPLPWWFPYTAPCWCWLLRGGLNSSLCRLLHKEAWMSSWDGSWLLPGGASDEVEGEEQRKDQQGEMGRRGKGENREEVTVPFMAKPQKLHAIICRVLFLRSKSTLSLHWRGGLLKRVIKVYFLMGGVPKNPGCILKPLQLGSWDFLLALNLIP